MKKTIWQGLSILVIIIALLSILLLFTSGRELPPLFELPGVFWIGIAFTAILVAATYLGSIYFPFKDEEKL